MQSADFATRPYTVVTAVSSHLKDMLLPLQTCDNVPELPHDTDTRHFLQLELGALLHLSPH